MSIKLFRRWSPEYALNAAYADVKEEGMRGLKRHLTAKALKSIERLDTVSSLTTIVIKNNPTNLLISKMVEFEYVVLEMQKDSETANCLIGFNYQDKVEGTIEIRMIKEDKEWKIDGLENPRFDKMDLKADED